MNDSESVQNAEDAVEEKLQRSWLEDCQYLTKHPRLAVSAA